MIKNVEQYFIDGCGRCENFATAQCKVRSWQDELSVLRRIVLESELLEEAKWGVPCYTYCGKNVVILSALKSYCALGFFKGVLLSDPHKLLIKPGLNSQADRQLRFFNMDEIIKSQSAIREYLQNAIAVEKAGLKVDYKQNLEPIPLELATRLENDPVLKTAFESLTPGRKRSFIIYISQAKQTKSREARVDKCVPKILNGEGFFEHYKSMKK